MAKYDSPVAQLLVSNFLFSFLWLAERSARFQCRTNVETSEDATNPVRGTLYVRNNREHVVRTSMTHSAIASCAMFWFLAPGVI